MILWVRRSLVIVLEVLGAVTAAALVLATLLAWRLTEGPLRLESLEPYLVSGLTELAKPYQINLNETSITWGKDRTSLGLRASDVRILSPEGMLLATVPEVEIDLSVPALLLGRPAPKVVRLIGPQLRVIRTQDGSIQMSLATVTEAPSPGTGESDILQHWLDALVDEPNSASMLGALREVEIENAKMAVDDYQYNVRWLAPRANITLARDQEGMRGQLDLDVATGMQLTTLTGRLIYDRTSATMRARLDLDHFNPALLADWSPAFRDLTRINVPLQGQLAVRWARPLGLARVEFDLAAGKGELGIQPGQPPLAVEYAKLVGIIDRQQRTAEISNLYVDFGGPKVSAVAGAKRIDNNVQVEAQAEVKDMPADKLPQYWLPQIAKGAREWVTKNIVAGEVPQANARVSLTVPLADPAHPVVTSLQGTMNLSGITVHYFRPLPPATEAQGVAQFDRDVFKIDINGGRVGGIQIPKATVQLLGLHDDTDRADIELTAVGKLADQLQLLDHEPLGYAKRLNISAVQAGGMVTTRARFQFPLFHDLPIEMVAISAAANIKDASLPKLVAGQGLTGGQLGMVLDGGGMKISGTGVLGGAPAKFDWIESFVRDVSPASEISFSGTMDEAARQAFHVSWPDVVSGEVAVTGTYTKDRGQPATLEVQLDFAKAALALPWFAWYKPVGTAGSGSATVIIGQNQVDSVKSFAVSSGGARIRGHVDFAKESRWQKVVLDQLSAPGSDVKGDITNNGVAGLAMNLKGPAVDIRGVYEDGQTATPAPAAASTAGEKPELLPLDIKFDFRRAVTGEGRALHEAKGQITRNDHGWTRLDIDGRLNGTTPAHIHLTPTAAGRSLAIETQDAGLLFSTLRVMDNIRGGTLSVSGSGQGSGPVAATIDMRNFSYLNAETLKKIAAAAEPKGAEALAKDQGIQFKRLKARFNYAEDIISVREGRMSGDMLGLTLQGEVNLLQGRIDLAGTVVPLYGLNSAVSGIPIIGWLLTGGEGGGVVAAAYSVKGPLKDPTTSVNPLAMLVPGFLRELFFVDSK